MTLDRIDILSGLRELAERLDTAGLELTIHVVGGAAIAVEYSPERQATRDVDVWLNARPEILKNITAIALQVAVRRGWPSDWLNDRARMFIPDTVGAGPDDWRPTLTVGNVHVCVAQPEILLAMKLLAGRGRRDLPDLEPLVVAVGASSIDDVEAIFDRYYPHDDMKPSSRHWLTENLPPRDGRPRRVVP